MGITLNCTISGTDQFKGGEINMPNKDGSGPKGQGPKDGYGRCRAWCPGGFTFAGKEGIPIIVLCPESLVQQFSICRDRNP